MAKSILTFDEYSLQLTKKLRTLRHFKRCLFSAWCGEHLLTTHADLIEQNLSKSDLTVFRGILDDICDVLLCGTVPDAKMLNVLDEEFIGVTLDSSLDEDVHPIVIGVQNCLGLCILGCRRNDEGLAQAVAEAILDVIDFELAEKNPDYANDSSDEAFRYPELKQELDAQLAMIKHLQDDFTLDQSLFRMFR